MEFQFYAEQKYLLREGCVEARILTAEEASALGYEDGYVSGIEGGDLYVDGFDTKEDAQFHLESLVNCRIIDRPQPFRAGAQKNQRKARNER